MSDQAGGRTQRAGPGVNQIDRRDKGRGRAGHALRLGEIIHFKVNAAQIAQQHRGRLLHALAATELLDPLR